MHHKFQGHENGVTCLLCGLKMTQKEYASYLAPKSAETPTKKPRTTRKKKEATTIE